MRTHRSRFPSGPLFAFITLSSLVVGSFSALATNGRDYFAPGNLVVSRLVYDNNPSNVEVGLTQLPPNCLTCASAINDGTYPYIWNNVLVDGQFGITAKIFLDQLLPTGSLVNSLQVPNSSQNGVPPTKDQMVGSFSSKSEGALNLSADGRFITFMGYLAPVNALDVSNSNTPWIVDTTNPDRQEFFRVVAQVNQHGKFQFTKSNAFSGDNGRAVILNNLDGANVLYAAGNAGAGTLDPQPDGIIVSTGAQVLEPQVRALVAQDPGLPTPVGSFNITQLGLAQDKIGKDTNFRGIAIFDNVVYYTKGSGSNGINTVYYIDTTGYDQNGAPLTCPTGTGLPSPVAALPTTPLPYDVSLLQTKGLVPNNMCILKGFPVSKSGNQSLPFALWFADAHTLYIADEGNGTKTYNSATDRYTAAASQTLAGLQKWVFNTASQAWERKYVLQAGLDLGVPYTIPGYPTGFNTAISPLRPWRPATDGLRNIAGRVNGDGTTTIWAITSTVSGNGDVGADPNKLVMITDDLSATTLPASESFATIRAAGFGEVLRGVSLAPGTDISRP